MSDGCSLRYNLYFKNLYVLTYVIYSNWFVPSEHSSEQGALQTPFVKVYITLSLLVYDLQVFSTSPILSAKCFFSIAEWECLCSDP